MSNDNRAFEICEEMDASVFSSDTFHSKKDLAMFRMYLSRWTREAAAIEVLLQNDED